LSTSHLVVSGCTGPIFTKFSPYGRYLVVDYSRDLLFQSLKGRCYGNQSVYSPTFVTLAFQKRGGISQFRVQNVQWRWSEYIL